MYGYYTDHLYIASVDGLPEYTGDTVTSAITLYVDILPRLKSGGGCQRKYLKTS